MLGIETWQVVGLGYFLALTLGLAIGAYVVLWSTEPRYTPLPPVPEPLPTVRVVATQPALFAVEKARPYDWAHDGECIVQLAFGTAGMGRPSTQDGPRWYQETDTGILYERVNGEYLPVADAR